MVSRYFSETERRGVSQNGAEREVNSYTERDRSMLEKATRGQGDKLEGVGREHSPFSTRISRVISGGGEEYGGGMTSLKNDIVLMDSSLAGEGTTTLSQTRGNIRDMRTTSELPLGDIWTRLATSSTSIEIGSMFATASESLAPPDVPDVSNLNPQSFQKIELSDIECRRAHLQETIAHCQKKKTLAIIAVKKREQTNVKIPQRFIS